MLKRLVLWMNDRLESIAIGILITGLFIIIYFSVRMVFDEMLPWGSDVEYDKTGQIGDFIGGVVGSLWALVGVLLFYRALMLQRDALTTQNNALDNQQEELKLQREELKLQREELRKTREVFSLQQFETTFFNMLRAHQELRDNIEFDVKNVMTWIGSNNPYITERYWLENPKVRGLDFFEFALEDFNRWYNKFKLPENEIFSEVQWLSDDIKYDFFQQLNDYEEMHTPSFDNPKERVAHKYDRFWRNYHHSLGHYFRHVFYILKHIEDGKKREVGRIESEYKNEPRQSLELDIIDDRFLDYAGVLRAHLSAPEQALLYYNGLSFAKQPTHHEKSAKNLIEEYKLVRSFTREDLADPERHHDLYEGIELLYMSDALQPDVEVARPFGEDKEENEDED